MVRFALKTPYTIFVVAMIMLVVGVFSMLKMPLDILPTFKLPAVMVVTTYTGMPAEMMEMDITNRLERWLSQAAGLDHMESRSMIGVSVLNCFFEPGFDPNNALAQISTLVMSDLHYLPPGTQPPIVIGYDPTANLPAALMTIFTPGLDEAMLWDESNYVVRNQINAVPGAVAPVVFGGKQRQIMVYLNPGDLAGHHESPLDVVDALKAGNSMVPTGDVKIGQYDYSITSNGMVPDLKSFDSLPIRVTNGAPVLIRDVGHTMDASAVQTNSVQVNGVKETYIPLFRRMGASTLRVVDNIKAAIPNVLRDLPPGSELKLAFDQSPHVQDAISDVIRELVVGVLLASVVIYFFLGSLTPTLIASLIIPLSVLGGMLALYYCGQTLNIMTLGGLALITGPLIDKAVVALENIERHLEMGATPYDAAEKGASEVTMPVLMASLALIVVFYPVTFFQGLGKFLFIPMALSVAVTEIISYFAVMTLVPLLAAKLFKAKADHHQDSAKVVVVFNRGFQTFRDKYCHALDNAIAKPQVTIALTLSALVMSMFLLPFIGTEFFPVSDNGQFYVRVRGKTGLRLELMNDLVMRISHSIQDDLPKDSVEMVLANTGVIPSWAAAYSPNTASHDSILEVGLSEKSSVKGADAIKILRSRLQAEYLDTHFSFSLIDPVASALNYGSLSSIDLRITSPNLEKGQEIATAITERIRGVRGVKDAFVEQQLDYPALHLEVDRTKAAYLGFSADEVVKNIITALNSSVLFSPNFWDDPVSGNNYFIGAMYPEQKIDSLETIQNIPLIPKAGSAAARAQPGEEDRAVGTTLLRNVAILSPAKIPVEISHFNIKRVFDVMANLEDRDIGGAASEIDGIVARMNLPKGYNAQWVGQVDSMRSSFSSMGVGMILSLVLIFLLLVAQLKSFVDPLLILATVPMGFIGVFWILFLTNTTFNIQSMMGMIMLIGIVVSNTVILTDFANGRIEAGVSPTLAIREAGLTRLRPILMTAISAIMALFPSSLSGANAPLARAVIGGLLSATFLSLIFLPALYVLFKKQPQGQFRQT
jgi:multidrug efflux pump subunit AcrB